MASPRVLGGCYVNAAPELQTAPSGRPWSNPAAMGTDPRLRAGYRQATNEEPTMHTRRRSQASLDPFTTLRVCASCGARRVLMSFPRFPGESRRGDVCNLCVRYPSTVHAAA